jgi:hypothetical protein
MIHKRITFRRHQRQRVISRKKRISRKIYGERGFYEHDGQYSKGKIHCSCWMCSSKAKWHGISVSNLKKIAKCDNHT